MPPQTHFFYPRKNSVAFAYSSKDRMHYTRTTIGALLDQKDCDLFWIDGSDTDEGRTLPFSIAQSSGRINEIHTNVTGGADHAVLYGLSLLYERGYDYIGLIENDVKLLPGWWPKTFGLFQRGAEEGLKVGSVSARCHSERILVDRDSYAVMMNVGAGVVLYTREALAHVLNYYRAGSIGEMSFLVSHYTGQNVRGLPWQINDANAAVIPQNRTTSDWFFETSLMAHGLSTLAPTPSLAENLDDPDRHPLQREATRIDKNFNWPAFCARLLQVRQNVGVDFVRGAIPYYDPILKQWRCYMQQLIKAVPQAFDNGWRCVWSKYMGPFGMRTLRAGATLQLKVEGKSLGLFCDSKKPFHILVDGTNSMAVDTKGSWEIVGLNFVDSGPHALTLQFDEPDVLLTCLHFEAPQSWMKDGYALRYDNLAPYF